MLPRQAMEVKMEDSGEDEEQRQRAARREQVHARAPGGGGGVALGELRGRDRAGQGRDTAPFRT